MARIELAWELGAGTGHYSTLLPIGLELKARGHEVRFHLREHDVGMDLPGALDIPRQGAPIWVGPTPFPNPVNYGEILINFGYANRSQFEPLLAAWRERIAGANLVIANVAPAALLAARTLGVPALEISQGFHTPPPVFPSPALREWEPPPTAKMRAADQQVLTAINAILGAFGSEPLATLGELFLGRSILLTYPELDIYPGRPSAEYAGIVPTGELGANPIWPAASGPRVFGYLYKYYVGLPKLLAAIADLDVPALIFCRGIEKTLRQKYRNAPIVFSDVPMSVTQLLPRADIVICHASHQMTAQALLAGKPLLLLPTQVEQMLIARRVERIGAGVAVAQASPASDFSVPLAILTENKGHGESAASFAARYARLDRTAVLAKIADRCEQLLASGR